MSSSPTFNYVSSYSILKTLTSFISHRFACHHWQPQIELFAGCLPQCLVCVRKFLSGFHPTYHFSVKKIIIRRALGKAPQESNGHAQSQPGRTERHAHVQGEVRDARELWFSPAVQLTKHRTSFLYLVCDLSSDGTGETLGLVPSSSAPGSPSQRMLLRPCPPSAKSSTQKGNCTFPPRGPTMDNGISNKCISWMGTDATAPFP